MVVTLDEMTPTLAAWSARLRNKVKAGNTPGYCDAEVAQDVDVPDGRGQRLLCRVEFTG
jgi:hypothetical protein